MESIDIYDKYGNITDTARPKEQPLKDGEYKLAVGMWIVNDKGEIFLTKRAPEKRYMPNKWENPAGHVQTGEDCTAAIIRELQEETGLIVTPEQITFFGASCAAPYLGRDYGVRMNFDIDVIRLQPGETSDAKWVDFSEFRKMLANDAFAPSLKEHMEDYKENFLKFIGQTEL